MHGRDVHVNNNSLLLQSWHSQKLLQLKSLMENKITNALTLTSLPCQSKNKVYNNNEVYGG